MYKSVKLIAFMFFILMAGSVFAQLSITGDARVRPRLDIRETVTTDDIETTTKRNDGYYYYRARLNFKGDIGEGWFGHVQLGTNGLAYWTGKFGEGDVPSSSVSVDGAGRGNVNFMLIYFGRKTKKFGYMGGLIPVNGLANPILDLHYYSHKMIDVPFFFYSNNGAHGFSGYIGFENGSKLNATLLVDDNVYKTETEVDSLEIGGTYSTEDDLKDKYTLLLDAPLKFSDFTFQPMVFLTAVTRDAVEAPLTVGANLTTPKVGKFTFTGSFGYSSQTKENTAEYNAWYTRLKAVGGLGKGKLTAWVDLANKEFDADNAKNKFLYIWLDYKIPVYKSDKGAVSIKPTWRHISEKREDGNGSEYYSFTRNKYEVTIDFNFK